ncbi:patatin-like phospholipase family protein [Salinisphaera hydrothermalis]|uniref:patatin-like phospholipase family protein n=1 Tax=Salinisphaera hydrothermalis TaxID=563188 RepID=UPI00333FE8BA
MDTQAILRANPLFRDLDRRALRTIAARAEWVEIGGGEYLFRAGDDSDALYVIVSGRIRVVRPREDGPSMHMGELGAGEMVGEISIIREQKHSADGLAMRDTQLLRISRAQFESLVSRHPQAMLQVTRLIADRLSDMLPMASRDSVQSGRTYAVVPAHPGVDVAGFSRALSSALAAYAPTLRIDATRVDAALGPGTADADLGAGESHRALTRWLTHLEERYRYLIYQGSAEPDAWTRRGLRQADRVLIVAYGDQRPFLSRNLAWLGEQALRAPMEIVLLYGEDDEHSALGWRRVANAGFHHRVARDYPPAQMGRVARLISGRANCLVLGGGGARGFAHVGLVRALHEKNIPIDAVGGTSMGALIAGMIAMGDDATTMLARLRETFVTGKYLNDYSLSRISLITAEKFRRQLGAIFGDRLIENLELPFYCLSTNLSRSVPVVHDEGELATWVAASMAVPGIAPPTVHRGELLVDGGLLNAIPFDTMAEMGRGHVIVSDVSSESTLTVEMADDSPTTSLLSLGAAGRHLNMFRILFHTATLSSDRERREIDARADLALHMPVEGVGMFDWDTLDDVVYRGYCHADQKLDEWQAALEARGERGDGFGRPATVGLRSTPLSTV